MIATRQSVLAVLSPDWHPPKEPGLSILTDHRWWDIFHWGRDHGHELPGWDRIEVRREGSGPRCVVRVDYLKHSDDRPEPVHPPAEFVADVPPPIPEGGWLDA